GDLEVGCARDFGHGIDYDADDLGRLGLGDEGEERPELGQEALEVVGPAFLPEEVCKVVDGLFFDAGPRARRRGLIWPQKGFWPPRLGRGSQWWRKHLLRKDGRAHDLQSLLTKLRPFFSLIPKAKTAKIVRVIIDAVAKIPGTSDLQISLCKEIVQWTRAEKRTFLRQRIEARRAALLRKRTLCVVGFWRTFDSA
ncbi:26S proteasome non-ATPase regulatory subunit, partial [Striga asiatica]